MYANSCYSDLQFCNDEQICTQATRGIGKADLANKTRLEPNRVWSSSSLYMHFVKVAKKRGLDCGVNNTAKTTAFRSTFDKLDFNKLNNTQRKQLQYGLKKLGYYKSSIDGVWGKNTNKAVNNYIRSASVSSNYPMSVLRKLARSVSLPTSFNSSKPKSVTSSKVNNSNKSNSKGLRSITSNPIKSADEAYELCRIQGNAAYAQAYNNLPIQGYSSYTAKCTQDLLYDYRCKISPNTGGFAGGFGLVMDKTLRANGAYAAVRNSCLAHYGWKD